MKVLAEKLLFVSLIVRVVSVLCVCHTYILHTILLKKVIYFIVEMTYEVPSLGEGIALVLVFTIHYSLFGVHYLRGETAGLRCRCRCAAVFTLHL